MVEVVVEPIAECQETRFLTLSDMQYIESLSAKRAVEVTAWRTVLRRKLNELFGAVVAGSEIKYDSVGAPYLVGCEVFIGVSHCASHVAVVISDRRCAIDIERRDRDFLRVSSRYVSDSERRLNDDISFPLLPLLWSAKETLYKYSNREGLCLINDLKISAIDADNQTMMASITPHKTPLTLNFRLLPNLVLVYI